MGSYGQEDFIRYNKTGPRNRAGPSVTVSNLALLCLTVLL